MRERPNSGIYRLMHEHELRHIAIKLLRKSKEFLIIEQFYITLCNPSNVKLNVKVVSTQRIYRIYTLIHTETLTSRMEQGIELDRENENALHTT